MGECTAATVAVAGAGLAGCHSDKTEFKNNPPVPSDWWEEGRYVDHRVVNSSRRSQGIIRARVDGRWTDFEIRSLPDRFVDWSLQKRIKGLDKLAKYGFDPEDLDGPHNGCVATYGGWCRESVFSLNTAYKGIGFVPKPERLEETLTSLQVASQSMAHSSSYGMLEGMVKKTEYLRELYSDKDRFDRTKQVSLELFTTPTYATHTFLNLMANPIASFSFLAFPTFEVRSVAELLHPENPKLDAYQKNIISYVNGIHNFVHSGKKQHMTCVYHVLEVYDDSPGGLGGTGTRIA